jgi:intraflagellar transport protein 172
MHDKAGDFYERLDELPKALDSYVRGHAYGKAVGLAKRCFPNRVVELQEQWGDYLVSQKQIDMAINHYIEANVKQKAVEAALDARQFAQALRLVDSIDNRDVSKPYYKQLARYYEDTNQVNLAERCFLSADQPHLAVEMHIRLGHTEVAHKLAMNYMSEGEVGLLYINQAQKLENQGRLREAEKLYLTVQEKDLAINMYKKHRRFDDMIRLVQEHRPNLLKDTHLFLAQTLEMETSFRDAEHHYVEAQEWTAAVNMYRTNDLWDDAIRVAKFHGGLAACKRVTPSLLMAVGVIEGSKFLNKHGLVDAAIEQATESGHYDMAFEIAHMNNEKKLPEIHLKYALFLEDDEKYSKAEEEFIKAQKPKEAIDMYVHLYDWANAIRVAEYYDPSSVPEILVAQGKVKADAGDYNSAEELFLAASRPEIALNMYKEANMWEEALRLAQMHLPHRVVEVNQGLQQMRGPSKKDPLGKGKVLEQNRQYNEAIDAYLAANSSKIDSIDHLEELWDRAVEIAHKFVPNRHVEVALEVSRRLQDLHREETAADILVDINRQNDAVNMLLTARKFEKARAIARGNSNLMRRVEEDYQEHLVVKEDHKELVELGKSEVALDVLAKRGDWERLWEVATKEHMSASALSKYVLMFVEGVRVSLKI